MPRFVIADAEEIDAIVAGGGINKKTAEKRAYVVGYLTKE
jgi:hypothetical protein